MAAIDSKPDHRKPIEIAGELVRRDDTLSKQGATCICDLMELASAQEQLLVCYRLGKRPTDKLLDTLRRKKSLLGFN